MQRVGNLPIVGTFCDRRTQRLPSWEDVSADADPGIYLMHCHKVNHVMNGTFYPGGMLTGEVYRSVMDTNIFNQLLEYVGYSA